MDDQPAGCTFALLAALSWALAVLLFKIGGERIPPLALNLFKNLLAAVLIVITLAVIGDLTGLMEEGLGTIRDFSTREILLLSLSGLLGITLADTCFFYSLNIVGVGITGIVDCLYTPSLVILSWLFLGEVLTGPQYLGALLIVAAVAVTARHEPPEGVSRGRLLTGILLNVFSKVIMAVAIVIVKDLFETKPIWWTTLLRTAAGALSLMLPPDGPAPAAAALRGAPPLPDLARDPAGVFSRRLPGPALLDRGLQVHQGGAGGGRSTRPRPSFPCCWPRWC